HIMTSRRLALLSLSLFFFNDPATTSIYTLSLHDALPIYTANYCRSAVLITHSEEVQCVRDVWPPSRPPRRSVCCSPPVAGTTRKDRKSTRLNSSHVKISYAVFCLKKKKKPRRARIKPATT